MGNLCGARAGYFLGSHNKNSLEKPKNRGGGGGK